MLCIEEIIGRILSLKMADKKYHKIGLETCAIQDEVALLVEVCSLDGSMNFKSACKLQANARFPFYIGAIFYHIYLQIKKSHAPTKRCKRHYLMIQGLDQQLYKLAF